jgi:hypothetical protein
MNPRDRRLVKDHTRHYWAVARARREGCWEEAVPMSPPQLSEEAKAAAQERWEQLLQLRAQKVRS